jgi:hypothetical protein
LKKKKIIKQSKLNGFDSDEEEFFNFWCKEALENDIIEWFKYSQETFLLSEPKFNHYSKSLLQKHVYTDDFQLCIDYNSRYEKIMNKIFKETGIRGYKYIDIKGVFNKHGGDREFSINRKWVMEKHGKFINKIVPEKLFKKTWVPECYLKYTPDKKDVVKKYQGLKTVKEFIKEFKNGR